jgi:hypothetical protein
MRKAIKFFVLAAVIAAVPVISLTASTAAYAGTIPTACNGTNCSGLDPMYSFNSLSLQGCAVGAGDVWAGDVLGGYLELRWGPNCQTNWTRFTPGNSDAYQISVENLDTGVWAGTGLYNWYYWVNQAHISHYSDQVYTGPQPAAACVWDLTTEGYYCYEQ